MNLDLKSIVLYLNIQGFSAKEIHENINMTLGSGAIGYSTINKYIRSQSFYQQNKSIKNSENLMFDEENKILIVNALKNFPFSSVREIAKMTYIPKSTVYRILTQQLNYVNKHLKWVPHSLKPSQLIQRVDASKELLKILAKVKKSNKYLFYTGDESWFYLNTYYNQQWLPEGDTPSKRVKKTIDSKKFMITVFWNSEEFLLVEALDDNMKFNEDYFINKILEKIILKTFEDREQLQKKLILHYDNARPHISKRVSQYLSDHKIIKAPQPPYSPDIAPSDFYLFGYLKQQLQGCEFGSKEELLQTVTQIIEEIPIDTLNKVFTEWERRLCEVIHSNGDYI